MSEDPNDIDPAHDYGAGDDFELTEDAVTKTIGAVKFDDLSPTAFEEFIFDLMSECGFTNVDWRKGTPKDSSPARTATARGPGTAGR